MKTLTKISLMMLFAIILMSGKCSSSDKKPTVGSRQYYGYWVSTNRKRWTAFLPCLTSN
jgi:hypothetical protein